MALEKRIHTLQTAFGETDGESLLRRLGQDIKLNEILGNLRDKIPTGWYPERGGSTYPLKDTLLSFSLKSPMVRKELRQLIDIAEWSPFGHYARAVLRVMDACDHAVFESHPITSKAVHAAESFVKYHMAKWNQDQMTKLATWKPIPTLSSEARKRRLEETEGEIVEELSPFKKVKTHMARAKKLRGAIQVDTAGITSKARQTERTTPFKKHRSSLIQDELAKQEQTTEDLRRQEHSARQAMDEALEAVLKEDKRVLELRRRLEEAELLRDQAQSRLRKLRAKSEKALFEFEEAKEKTQLMEGLKKEEIPRACIELE